MMVMMMVIFVFLSIVQIIFSYHLRDLTLLVGRREWHPSVKSYTQAIFKNTSAFLTYANYAWKHASPLMHKSSDSLTNRLIKQKLKYHGSSTPVQKINIISQHVIACIARNE